MQLTLGISPCPNDTFAFYALTHGLVHTEGVRFSPVLVDVETLNRLAARGELDVAKVSYGALPYLLDDYVLLRSGGALGRGCGPLLVGRSERSVGMLQTGRIAIPGRRTTANLLLRLWNPSLPEGMEVVYSQIMPSVSRGDFEAGLIIHESRFTYPEYGLARYVDLGEWWEEQSALPIPLGGIVARRRLGDEVLVALERWIRASVEHAFTHPSASTEYVALHAQEMNEEVRRRHIDLYVNEHSIDLGDEGERAVYTLLARAAEAGIAPGAGRGLFLSRC
jgi:1,4-dihydroxy-6-naphthoate synthase